MALVPYLGSDIELFINQLQTGHGIAMYRASPLQAGDGFLNWMPFLSRLGPRFLSAAKSVLPAAREIATDALKGAASAAISSGADQLRNVVSNSSTLQTSPDMSNAANNLIERVEKRTLNTIGDPTYVKKRRYKVTRRAAPTVLD